MVDVPINHEVLVWARKQRGLSLDKAARALKLTLDELEKLEDGSKRPSLGLLDRIANKYKIPFATLLMPLPLPDTERPKLPDFRTFAGAGPTSDQDLLTALDVVDSQTEALAELRLDHVDLFAYEPLSRYSVADGPRKAAEMERERLGPTLEEQFAWPSAAQAFRRFRVLVERAGVFVYLMNLGPLSNVRGFSIFDEREIPVVVINSDEDETAARTFSLFHEYAHILVRATGISDQNRTNSVERWCNQFAAYYLMPAERFVQEAVNLDQTGIWADATIKKIANLFKVSMRAVALHLEDLRLAPVGFYEARSKLWAAGKKPKKPGGAPMSYAEREIHRLGIRHVSIVLDALEKGYVNQIDAYELTDIAPKHYGALKKEIQARQITYGGVR